MRFDPSIHHRRSVRLTGFDYASSGVYFVTLVTHQRTCLLSRIYGDDVRLTDVGQIAHDEWFATAQMRKVELGTCVLMPNHLHGVLVFRSDDAIMAGAVSEERAAGSQKASLGALIGGYKAAVTRRCRTAGLLPDEGTLWQRSFYEHVIRNENDWNAVDAYIADNPRRWSEDSENPDRITQ